MPSLQARLPILQHNLHEGLIHARHDGRRQRRLEHGRPVDPPGIVQAWPPIQSVHPGADVEEVGELEGRACGHERDVVDCKSLVPVDDGGGVAEHVGLGRGDAAVVEGALRVETSRSRRQVPPEKRMATWGGSFLSSRQKGEAKSYFQSGWEKV